MHLHFLLFHFSAPKNISCFFFFFAFTTFCPLAFNNARSSWWWTCLTNSVKLSYIAAQCLIPCNCFIHLYMFWYLLRVFCTVLCSYLGVTITSRLIWSSHINKICASASRKLGFLRHKLKAAPSHVKLLAYSSIVRPQLEYASAAWDPFLKKDIHKLEMEQRKAVRFFFNSYHSRASPSLLMANNNIMTLENRRQLARLRFLFLRNSQQFNVNPGLYIQPRLSRSTRSTHEHNLTPIFARTTLFKHSFFPRTI